MKLVSKRNAYLQVTQILINIFGIVRHKLRIVSVLINVFYWELFG